MTTRVNARLDEARARKLEYLKRVTEARTSDVLKRAIDVYFEEVSRGRPGARRVLKATGFIASGEASPDLSEAYKSELRDLLSDKHDHR